VRAGRLACDHASQAGPPAPSRRCRSAPLDELELSTARWLASPAGLAAVADAVARLDADAGEAAAGGGHRDPGLALAAWARDRWPAAGRGPAVVAAAAARRRARGRWPRADELLFTRTGLEQASDPVVSAWRAARLAAVAGGSRRRWDLCAGIGGDTLAIATASRGPVTAVDRDAARLELLRHNARVFGVEVSIEVADALTVRPDPDDLVHADPGRRRADGRRLRRLADHQPPVGALVAAHRGVAGLAVALSPGVDLADPDLPADAELEFVAVDGQLVEAVAWTGELAVPGRAATATLLRRPAQTGHPPEHVAIARDRGPRSVLPVGPVGDHLVEVAAPAVRARLHDTIGAGIGARRLAQHRALLTCDARPPASPWYVARRVLAVLPARPRAVRAWLRARELRPVELTVHGLDADVGAWWRGLGRPSRGPDGWRVALVRLDEGAAAIVTEA
jgi:precorrin-6B methylase 2